MTAYFIRGIFERTLIDSSYRKDVRRVRHQVDNIHTIALALEESPSEWQIFQGSTCDSLPQIPR